MTARVLTITDAPMRQTIAVVRDALDGVLVWQPLRWVPDVRRHDDGGQS